MSSDNRTAMTEFGFLEEKRKLGSLSYAEGRRWEELRQLLGMAAHESPPMDGHAAFSSPDGRDDVAFADAGWIEPHSAMGTVEAQAFSEDEPQMVGDEDVIEVGAEDLLSEPAVAAHPHTQEPPVPLGGGTRPSDETDAWLAADPSPLRALGHERSSPLGQQGPASLPVSPAFLRADADLLPSPNKGPEQEPRSATGEPSEPPAITAPNAFPSLAWPEPDAGRSDAEAAGASPELGLLPDAPTLAGPSEAELHQRLAAVLAQVPLRGEGPPGPDSTPPPFATTRPVELPPEEDAPQTALELAAPVEFLSSSPTPTADARGALPLAEAEGDAGFVVSGTLADLANPVAAPLANPVEDGAPSEQAARPFADAGEPVPLASNIEFVPSSPAAPAPFAAAALGDEADASQPTSEFEVDLPEPTQLFAAPVLPSPTPPAPVSPPADSHLIPEEPLWPEATVVAAPPPAPRALLSELETAEPTRVDVPRELPPTSLGGDSAVPLARIALTQVATPANALRPKDTSARTGSPPEKARAAHAPVPANNPPAPPHPLESDAPDEFVLDVEESAGAAPTAVLPSIRPAPAVALQDVADKTQVAAAPAPPPPTVIAGEHRVVVHTLEGLVKRGLMRDVDLLKPEFVLEPQGSPKPEKLAAARLKAIFFMLPPGGRPPPLQGRKLQVTFEDGRQLMGHSLDSPESAPGFFLFPSDNRTNTSRIYIFRAGVQSIREL